MQILPATNQDRAIADGVGPVRATLAFEGPSRPGATFPEDQDIVSGTGLAGNDSADRRSRSANSFLLSSVRSSRSRRSNEKKL